MNFSVKWNATPMDIINQCLSLIKLSQALFFGMNAGQWLYRIREYYPTIRSQYFSSLHQDLLLGCSVYELTMQAIDDGILNGRHPLSVLFKGHPFFDRFTLQDVIKCHLNLDPIYLNACIPASSFRLRCEKYTFVQDQIITWHMSGLEVFTTPLFIEHEGVIIESPNQPRIAEQLEVSEQSLEEEEEGEEAQDFFEQHQIELVTYKSCVKINEDPIGVVFNIDSFNGTVANLKLDDNFKFKADVERLPRKGNVFFAPCASAEKAKELAWALFYNGRHRPGTGKEKRSVYLMIHYAYGVETSDSKHCIELSLKNPPGSVHATQKSGVYPYAPVMRVVKKAKKTTEEPKTSTDKNIRAMQKL